tara:strand:- start:242 stop:697 length:456 start_codon:yes stop_codon:yes gene_type:complete
MIIKKILVKNEYLSIFFLILLVMHINNFFLNIYNILNKNLDQRLEKAYGNCEKHGYGFIKEIYSKYFIDSNILVLNNIPGINSYELSKKSIWFNYKVNEKINENKIILINNKDNFLYRQNSNVDFYFKEKKFTNYKIIYKNKDCYFLQKND